ncbi:carbon-nitrogen hydrolase family protein [Limibacter armeniacum]|uniref:carbon-nitrogen hydrolase family protein n=1 Tax=Limibacter armeniacum TaxID=466084 RepID=UPI002FE5C137
MKLAIVQLEPVKGDIEKNITQHVSWIKKAAQQGADMVVFPELSLSGYEPELASSIATNQDDKRLDVIQALSNEYQVTVGAGLPTRDGDNLFISMIIFRPSQARITYSKQFLYPTETSVFTAANNPLALPFGAETVAPAICYELSNKEHHEMAAQNKATAYVASVLNAVSGVDADLEKLGDIAKQYQMTTMMANFIGTSGGYACAGKSSVWNKDGQLLAQLGTEEEGMIVFDTETKEANIVAENR